MPNKPNIKWRQSDAEKLEKEVKRFNAKIYRTKTKHPELADILPTTIKKSDRTQMMNNIHYRADFNKELRSLERFNKKGAEKAIVSQTGNKVTQWEKREVGIKVAQINRERTRERKAMENLNATSRGESLGLKRGEMGSERMNELKPKKYDFNKIKGGKEWAKYKESVMKQSNTEAKMARLELFKANYIKGLNNAFGDHASELIEMVQNLPANVVVKTFYREQEATIEFFYEPQAMGMKLDIMNEIWAAVSDAYDDEING